LKTQAVTLPQLVPEAPQFKEIEDPNLGCVVNSLDAGDGLELQAAVAMGMQTDQADTSEAAIAELIGTYHTP